MNGNTVIDGAGATLMPGLCDAHTHLSWNNAPSLEALINLPPEEHTLFAADVAKIYLDHGFTMCVGAAAAKPPARRRHPQRDQQGPDPRPALSRQLPGDHHDRRPRPRASAAYRA